MCHSRVTDRDTDVSPVQEVTSENQDLRSPDSDSEGGDEIRSPKKSFDGFDMPSGGMLLVGPKLISTLAIDTERLSDDELAAFQKLAPVWEKSWRGIAAGVVALDKWIAEALAQLKKARITYPAILERRMHELLDGRLTASPR